MFSGRDWTQEAQGLGELYTAFVWIEGRAGCGNKKIHRGHGKGLGLEVRLRTVGRVKIGAALWLEWGVCERDMQPGLWRH